MLDSFLVAPALIEARSHERLALLAAPLPRRRHWPRSYGACLASEAPSLRALLGGCASAAGRDRP